MRRPATIVLLTLAFLLMPGPSAWAQPCGVFKVWATSEVLTSADLNASFQRMVDANSPPCVNDYSANLAQMQSAVNPFPASVESLPTTLAGELERIRFQLKLIIGGAQWYTVPDRTLARATSISLTEIPTPAPPATADTAKLYAKDSSGTTVLAYMDAAGTERTLLTSDISSTVASLTMPEQIPASVATPPPSNIRLYAIRASGQQYLAFKSDSGVQEVMPIASEQKGRTGMAGIIVTRPALRILNMTADRISLQGYPLFSVNNTVNLDITGNGGRGCDGAVCDPLLPETNYYIWLMYNSSTRARSMLATVDLAPYEAIPRKLPPGVDSIRLIGAWRTDGSAFFYPGIIRDTTFSYATPRQAVGCCPVGSGTLVIPDAPITAIRANIIIKFGLPPDVEGAGPDAIPDTGFIWNMATFKAGWQPIVGEAPVSVTAPIVSTTVPYIASVVLPLGDPATGPLTVFWSATVLPVTAYVAGWEIQTRDP